MHELLDEKFRFFIGVFGSSDEVLGSLESGVDFEKRTAKIYQKCKTQEDIQREFDDLQNELADQINEKTLEARQSILEYFDEDVARRLANCQKNTVASLDKFSQWMYYFFLIHDGSRVLSLNEGRLQLRNENGTVSTYNLQWKKAEKKGDIFLRKEDGFFRKWLDEAIQAEFAPVHIRFDNTRAERGHSFFDSHTGFRGVLSVDKLAYEGLGDQEHLILGVETEDGTILDEDLVNSILELPGEATSDIPDKTAKFIQKHNEQMALKKQQIQNANKEYFIIECEKLDAYSEDLKEGLERDIKELGKFIKEKNRESGDKTLEEMLDFKEESSKLKIKRNAA